MEWVELWVGHIRRIRITKKKKNQTKKLRRRGSQLKKSINPVKDHMPKLCILMGRVSPFVQGVDETPFFPCNSLFLDYSEDGGRKLQNVGS